MQIDPNTINEVATAANSEAGKALTLPAAHEIGELLGDVANIFRFYTTSNLGKVFTSWDAHRKAQKKQLTEGDIKKVVPLLQAAALEGDEESVGFSFSNRRRRTIQIFCHRLPPLCRS